MAIWAGRELELERHCFEDKVVPLSINGDCMKLVLAEQCLATLVVILAVFLSLWINKGCFK